MTDVLLCVAQPAGLGRQQELAVFDSTSIGDFNCAVHVSSPIQQDEKRVLY